MKNLMKRFVFFCTFASYIFSGCTSSFDNSTVTASEYATKIIGSWKGTVGELKEEMVFNPDSTFVCHIRQTGFIANTLSQSIPGTVYGSWLISGAKIIMEIEGEKNEHVLNENTYSIITAFEQNRIVLKSSGGDSSVFNRIINE